MQHDPRVDAQIAGAPEWAAAILSHLRTLVHRAAPDATEDIKWGRPFFLIEGRPLAMMAAFKAHCVFGFWKQGRPEKESEGGGQFGRITAVADLPNDAALLAEIAAVAAIVRAGPVKRERVARPPLETPADLAAALAGAPAARAAFDRFPPSCRREYVEWIVEAKRPETRARRIAETVAQCAQGRRVGQRYEKT